MRKKAPTRVEKDAIKELELELSTGVNPDLLPAPSPFKQTEYVPFGFDAVDYGLLKKGGLPMGQLTEFYGPEQGGKTLAALRMVAQCQRKYPNLVAIWIDTENRFDVDWAIAQGVDISPEKFRLYTTGDLAEASVYITKSLASGVVSIIVLDSVANADMTDLLTWQAFDPTSSIKSRPGGAAKDITKLVKAIGSYLNKVITMVIVVNQVRDKIGVVFGSPEDRPGGKALKHDVCVRIRFQSALTLYNAKNTEVIGHALRMQIKKNSKCGIPAIAETDEKNHPSFYNENGIQKGLVLDDVKKALALEIIQKDGAWFTWWKDADKEDVLLKIQGRDNLDASFVDDIVAYAKLKVQILETKAPVEQAPKPKKDHFKLDDDF